MHALAKFAAFCTLAALALAVSTGDARAQLDTTHWIPAVWAADNASGVVGDHWLILTTPETSATDVTVQEASGVTIYQGTVSNGAPVALHLGTWSSPYDALEAQGHITFGPTALNKIYDRGLMITADAPVYANLRNRSGSQGTSLTAKGKKALGQEFRVGVMRASDSNMAYHGIFLAVMATQPGQTIVDIDGIADGMVLTGTGGTGSPPTTPPLQITLEQHETYIVGVHMPNYDGSADVNDFNGTRVTADKNVAVISGSWLSGETGSGGRDVGIDQLAPVNLAGTQYVLLKGNADNGDPKEVPTAVAIADDTEIYLRGEATPYATLDAGEWTWIQGEYHASAHNLLVGGSKPFLMFQTIGGSNSTATPGFNYIPPLGADASQFVDNVHDVTYLGTATLGVIARPDATVAVEVNGNAVVLDPAETVEGTSDWVTYRQSVGNGDLSVSSDDTIAVAIFNVNNNIGAAGYFSGFPPTLADLDFDGVPDGEDNCPDTANPPMLCTACARQPQAGCDESAPATVQCDADGDGVGDACDDCPDDPEKTAPGACGCGEEEVLDEHGDCFEDLCPNNPDKDQPGICGCDVLDTDSDGDDTPDCNDECPSDPDKTTPGTCGCGEADVDTDGDGLLDCHDNCPGVKNADQADCDDDGVGAACSDTPDECCGDDTQDTFETDVDCGGPACTPCGYTEGCEQGSDCQSALCLEDETCGCTADGDCPSGVCDATTHLCVECVGDADCAGVDDVCAPETCGGDQQCVADAPICDAPIFYGVVEGPDGTLHGIRCTQPAADDPPACDMDGDTLRLYEPMCGGE